MRRRITFEIETLFVQWLTWAMNFYAKYTHMFELMTNLEQFKICFTEKNLFPQYYSLQWSLELILLVDRQILWFWIWANLIAGAIVNSSWQHGHRTILLVKCWPIDRNFKHFGSRNGNDNFLSWNFKTSIYQSEDVNFCFLLVISN